MKTDKNNMDLQELLASLEHAGRDERRRQELGDMIDRMAAAEGRRHGFWWWGGRVAAAACIIFFISTAVRIWFIPTEEGVQVAEAVVPEVSTVAVPTVADSVAPVVPVKPQRRRTAVALLPEPETVADEPVEEPADIPIEESYAEEIIEDTDTLIPPTYDIVEDDFAPDAELLVAAVAVPVVEQQPAPQQAAPKRERRSFLSSLIREAEPSRMDGTTLTLLQF